jgi:hypothetical protein
MFEKISVSMLIFLNTLGINLDPAIVNEDKTIEKIENEIKVLNRKIEWAEATDDDFVSQNLRVTRYNKKIGKLNLEISKIKKVTALKAKWAKEDSLSSPNLKK